MTLSSETITTPGSNLVFNNSYDVSVSAQYRSQIIAAEQELQDYFTTAPDMTVSGSLAAKVVENITFAYGDLDPNAAANNDSQNNVAVGTTARLLHHNFMPGP